MKFEFNADQVLQMAARIERNGIEFYRAAAARTDRADVRARLLELAAMEEDHASHFEGLRETLIERERATLGADLSGVLTALADRRVFDVQRDPAAVLTGHETPEQIYLIAIGLEEDAVAFYSELKRAVPARRGQERLDDLIREEQHHIEILRSALAEL
jgi:rubrerythrin